MGMFDGVDDAADAVHERRRARELEDDALRATLWPIITPFLQEAAAGLLQRSIPARLFEVGADSARGWEVSTLHGSYVLTTDGGLLLRKHRGLLDPEFGFFRVSQDGARAEIHVGTSVDDDWETGWTDFDSWLGTKARDLVLGHAMNARRN